MGLKIEKAEYKGVESIFTGIATLRIKIFSITLFSIEDLFVTLSIKHSVSSAECCVLFIVVLNAIMCRVIMLNVIILSVV